jgi:hypothetical protein
VSDTYQRKFWRTTVYLTVIANVISSLAIVAYSQDMLPAIVDHTVSRSEQHGFLLVFACTALILMILAFWFAGKFAIENYRQLSKRCDSMESELIEVKGVDRAKLIRTVEGSTAASEKLSSLVDDSRRDHQLITAALEKINERLSEKPCQMTEQELRAHIDRVTRRTERND